MLSFAIICGANKPAADALAEQITATAATLYGGPLGELWDWSPRHCPSIRVLAWRSGSASNIDLSQGFRSSVGWKTNGNRALGEYLDIEINEYGTGQISRNKSGIYGLYKTVTPSGLTLFSNRSTFCAFCARSSTRFDLDQQYMAASMGVGWSMFSNSLFQSVTPIRPGEEPIFGDGNISYRQPDPEPFNNKEMRELWLRNPDSFWDSALEDLRSMFDQFFGVDGEPLIPFLSLSGGKDSRLIIALLLQRDGFRKVPIRTSGSPYHGDVIVASMICEKFDLKHLVSDVVFSDFEIGSSLREHLFVSEGRCAPHVPLRRVSKPPSGIHLYGHELGMREPFPVQDDFSPDGVLRAATKALGGFDIAGILTDDAVAEVRRLAREQIKSLHERTANPENVGWRFYIENRLLHYVVQLKQQGEFLSHVPFPLMSDRVGEMSYVIGIDARLEERPHYELMRRLEPWLVYGCPLNSQTWPAKLKSKEREHLFASPTPMHSSTLAPSSGMYAAADRSRAILKEFALDNAHKLAAIVDRSKISAAFEREKWTQHELGALVNLVMFCGASGSDWNDVASPAGDRLFPRAQYSTIPTSGSPDAAKVDLYLKIVPRAIANICRPEQASLILRDAYALQAEGRHDEAIPLYAAAASLGSPSGQLHLGRAYINGTGVNTNIELGIKYLKAALGNGNNLAAATLGDIYSQGNGVPKCLETALGFFTIASSTDDAWSSLKVAKTLDAMNRPSVKEWTTAYERLVSSGLASRNAYAAFTCWEIASKPEHDVGDTARSHLDDAVRLGHPRAKEIQARLLPAGA
ncbi:tetratricopeptide repeat protein [Hyphomicrobium facile]|uniref:Sel1 repeat-containing protein n=1 Tax=Hyphomicrobium facile TaxID=51670 RepID=A0A1I7MVM8_9HYPH|nr:tetratricopeptide repeat protein [Hyphomicrobium facile]SFV26459.1 hypothetical protein SAMN04488557_0484 [Hyphomicrobium facile]